MIGSKIKQLRLRRNLTQIEICDAIHMSQNAYSLLENGKTKIDHDRIIRIANFFNISPSQLLDTEELNSDNERVNEVFMQQNMVNENPELSEYLKLVIEKKDKQLEMLLRQNELLMKQISLKG